MEHIQGVIEVVFDMVSEPQSFGGVSRHDQQISINFLLVRILHVRLQTNHVDVIISGACTHDFHVAFSHGFWSRVNVLAKRINYKLCSLPPLMTSTGTFSQLKPIFPLPIDISAASAHGIRKARAAFANLSQLWGPNEIRLIVNGSVCNAEVRFNLFQGAETLTLLVKTFECSLRLTIGVSKAPSDSGLTWILIYGRLRIHRNIIQSDTAKHEELPYIVFLILQTPAVRHTNVHLSFTSHRLTSQATQQRGVVNNANLARHSSCVESETLLSNEFINCPTNPAETMNTDRLECSCKCLRKDHPKSKSFSCNTLSVPSCYATRRKHEGRDTARRLERSSEEYGREKVACKSIESERYARIGVMTAVDVRKKSTMCSIQGENGSNNENPTRRKSMFRSESHVLVRDYRRHTGNWARNNSRYSIHLSQQTHRCNRNTNRVRKQMEPFQIDRRRKPEVDGIWAKWVVSRQFTDRIPGFKMFALKSVK
ncbi:hypothetical protein CLF_112957, partial [Clonorchis sinensis]